MKRSVLLVMFVIEVLVLFFRSDMEKNLAGLFESLSCQVRAAAQPVAVQTKLKKHQAEALGWMLDKEIYWRDRLPPFWQERRVFGPLPWCPENAAQWGAKHIAAAKTFLLIVARFDRFAEEILMFHRFFFCFCL